MKDIELHQLTQNDAAFILALVTQPSFKAHIGDKGVYDLNTAALHIEQKYIEQYQRYGYGLWGIKDCDLDCYVGVCGLITRPQFAIPDLGYALLDNYTKQGYVALAAQQVIDLARNQHHLTALNAITSPTNHASIRVLEQLGFIYQQQFVLAGYQGVSNLYQRAL